LSEKKKRRNSLWGIEKTTESRGEKRNGIIVRREASESIPKKKDFEVRTRGEKLRKGEGQQSFPRGEEKGTRRKPG